MFFSILVLREFEQKYITKKKKYFIKDDQNIIFI